MIATRRLAIMLGLAGAAAAIPLIAQQRAASGPVARYDMRAGTVAGMGGMGQMNPMAMMMGGGRGNTAQHELHLRLGSSRALASGAAKADHFMPSGVKVGKSVALTYREERTGAPSQSI